MPKLLIRYLSFVNYLFFGLLFVYLLLFSLQSYSIYGPWGIFHYYLGAKYVKELGYFNLYSCALQTNPTIWKDTFTVRDLSTYTLIARNKLTPCPRKAFSLVRWKEFSSDVLAITKTEPSYYWSQV